MIVLGINLNVQFVYSLLSHFYSKSGACAFVVDE